MTRYPAPEVHVQQRTRSARRWAAGRGVGLVALCGLVACGGGGEAEPPETATDATPGSAVQLAALPAHAQTQAQAQSQAPRSLPSQTKPAASAGPDGVNALPVQVRLSPSDAVFPNPERGFYVWAANNLMLWNKTTAAEQYAQGHRLVFAVVRLDAFRNQPLSAAWLSNLDKRMDIARQNGLKLILRFAYNYPANETQYRNAKDAALPRVLGHIDQLKPLLQRNADVIAYLQAGFAGAWGEWHTSSNQLLQEPARSALRQALLRAMPLTHAVQFRYPPYLMAWSGSPPVAMDGSDNARSAFHNDCFLASATDVGTYSDKAAERAQQRAHMAALGAVAPFGGETCNPADDPAARPRNNCDDILAEGAQFGMTFLNAEYYREGFHNRWKAQGCYDTVARRLGYRFEFASIGHPASVRRGQALAVEALVRNQGWSRAYLPRRFELLLRHSSTGAETRVPIAAVDPRQWRPQLTSSISGQGSVPATLPTGRYDVYLALPDGAPSLAANARYAIRPANADNSSLGQQWDAARGAFKTGSQISITP